MACRLAPASQRERQRRCLARASTAPRLAATPAGLAVINTITRDKLCDNATAMGQLIADTLRTECAGMGHVREIRGRGLMLGVELRKDCGELVQRAMEAGLLINVAGGNTVRLLPPLVISESEARDLAGGVADLIRNFD